MVVTIWNGHALLPVPAYLRDTVLS